MNFPLTQSFPLLDSCIEKAKSNKQNITTYWIKREKNYIGLNINVLMNIYIPYIVQQIEFNHISILVYMWDTNFSTMKKSILPNIIFFLKKRRELVRTSKISLKFYFKEKLARQYLCIVYILSVDQKGWMSQYSTLIIFRLTPCSLYHVISLLENMSSLDYLIKMKHSFY